MGGGVLENWVPSNSFNILVSVKHASVKSLLLCQCVWAHVHVYVHVHVCVCGGGGGGGTNILTIQPNYNLMNDIMSQTE